MTDTLRELRRSAAAKPAATHPWASRRARRAAVFTVLGTMVLATAACDTIFPPREGFDVAGGGSEDPGGGDPYAGVLYPYDPGCNCAAGYLCTEETGCQNYGCFASGRSWWEASALCAYQGMQLARIHTEKENKFVADLCGRAGADVWWTGAHDVLSEGVFTTVSGESSPFTKWADGEPAGERGADCVAMAGRRGDWSASACNDVQAFACVTPMSGFNTGSLGSPCYNVGVGSECGPAQLCVPANALQGIGVCTMPCEDTSECPENTRCTTTPDGAFCMRRCQETAECMSAHTSFRCIRTPSAESVCWAQGATSGEVVTTPQLVLDRLVFLTDGSDGMPFPGATLTLQVFVRNIGDGDAFGVRATVAPRSPFVSDLSNFQGEMIDTIVAFDAPVVVVSPRLTLSSELPLGQTVELLLTINESGAGGSAGRSWQVPFGITAYKSPALPYVTRVDFTDGETPGVAPGPGQSARFVLSAENLGWGAAQSVQCDVSAVSGTATVSGVAASPVTFADPNRASTVEVLQVASGTLTVAANHPAGSPVVLRVVFREPRGSVWQQDLSLPTP